MFVEIEESPLEYEPTSYTFEKYDLGGKSGRKRDTEEERTFIRRRSFRNLRLERKQVHNAAGRQADRLAGWVAGWSGRGLVCFV